MTLSPLAARLYCCLFYAVGNYSRTNLILFAKKQLLYIDSIRGNVYNRQVMNDDITDSVAQLDRAFDYESKGRVFESRRGHHRKHKALTVFRQSLFYALLHPIYTLSTERDSGTV